VARRTGSRPGAHRQLIVERLASPAEQLAGLLFAFVLYKMHDRHATVAFQRENVRLAGLEVQEEGVRLRTEYLNLVRDVIRAGASEGEFRKTDVPVQSLLIFGSAQWAWTWFDPTGGESVEQIGSAFVDLVLGSLLVRRTTLRRLADPEGSIVEVVRSCLADAAAAPVAQPV
jgi:hypothetical protein